MKRITDIYFGTTIQFWRGASFREFPRNSRNMKRVEKAMWNKVATFFAQNSYRWYKIKESPSQQSTP